MPYAGSDWPHLMIINDLVEQDRLLLADLLKLISFVFVVNEHYDRAVVCVLFDDSCNLVPVILLIIAHCEVYFLHA